ncbi:MAG: glucose-1-phosphate adenylyltransferase [Planctomycetes bacterium]|nr:glucose-1-phosphate adenylyltransferase [Planctomycetota bacterium]
MPVEQISRTRLRNSTLGLLLAGGQGERLHPLTRDRAKPAVPFGGIYRIIDFTLSNCVNSGIRKVHILTQYKSISLDRHLALGWRIFNYELGEFIDTIPPQQRTAGGWYRGTADAIFQNIYTLERERPTYVLILSGDHVYKMDYSEMLVAHVEKGADLTIACIEANIEDARRFGVAQVDADNRIIGFEEKPAAPKPLPNDPTKALASMGIYVFNTDSLVRSVVADAKRDSAHDFGKDIIPAMVKADKVYAYNFKDENKKEVKYWRDIGTIDAYWEANMDLVQVSPLFNLYDKDWPIRTHQDQYPPAKTVFADVGPGGRAGMVLQSLVSSGCIISGASVERSILSPDVRVENYSQVTESIIMEGVRIGSWCRLRRCIVDKGVVIPDGAQIGFNRDEDAKRFLVTEKGIAVVPKEAAIGATE